MEFKEELAARLRRLCGVDDDTCVVEVEQSVEYNGHCSECEPSGTFVVTVSVYDNAPGEKVGLVLGSRDFYNVEWLFEQLVETELNI